jgi:hypothetical protein
LGTICPASNKNLELLLGKERSLHGEGLKKGPVMGLMANFMVWALNGCGASGSLLLGSMLTASGDTVAARALLRDRYKKPERVHPCCRLSRLLSDLNYGLNYGTG